MAATRTYTQWLECIKNCRFYDFDECPPEFRTYELWLALVENDPYKIQDVPVEFQTEELCIAAVTSDAYAIMGENSASALEYVVNRTPAVCLAAVQVDGRALEFVEVQTPDIVRAALKRTPAAAMFVKPSLCIRDGQVWTVGPNSTCIGPLATEESDDDS